MGVIHLNKDNFNDTINTEKKVLIDFWASWCGPCSMIAPVVEEIAAEGHDFLVCKVNVDEEPELAQKFNVRSIPMLVVLKNGETAAVTIGAQPKAAILKFVSEA